MQSLPHYSLGSGNKVVSLPIARQLKWLATRDMPDAISFMSTAARTSSVKASYNDTNVSSHEGKKATPQSLARVDQPTNMYQYSKWESRFSLGLDAAKNTRRIKKSYK